MKRGNLFVLKMLSIVLVFGFVLLGCAGTGTSAVEVPNNDHKTIIITGFDLPVEGIKQISVKLTGDWLASENTWVTHAVCDTAQLNGQTLTIGLYQNREPWTGTGEYGVNINIFPKEGKTVAEYRYRYNMPGNRTINIKDTETTIEWSDFVFGWNWESE